MTGALILTWPVAAAVLFAALLGAWFLRESFNPQRIAGTAFIVAWVMAPRMG